MDEKSCVTSVGTSNVFDVQNKWEEKTHTQHISYLSSIFVFCERTGIATPHARGNNPPWELSTTVVYVPEWPITIQKIPYITVGAEYHGSMYQSGRLPSKQYRALPWCLNTAVNVTNLRNRYREEPCKF